MSAPADARPNVLVLYGLLQHPVRAWHRQHLYSFRRYGSARYFYVNMGVRRLPLWLRRVKFDAVVFHHTLTGQRMQPPILAHMLRRARALREIAPLRIALLQDECIFTDLMSKLFEEFSIDHAFSLAPNTEWKKIYPAADHERVTFHRVLAGYLDEDSYPRIDEIVAETPERTIEVGYRAWSGLMSLGRHGLLRRRIAEVFKPAVEARGLSNDISVDEGDVHHGEDWYRYLASVKYLLGAEGGATVLDRSGEIYVRTERYLSEHPDATFEEVEAACFPGEDGKLALFAISPRHLDAVATRTCQVLVEGDYSGVLKGGEHYIEVKRDLSNVEQVLDQMRDEELRERIVETAHRDIVVSGLYTYRRLVEQIEAESGLAETAPRAPESGGLRFRHRLAELTDKLSWATMAAYVHSARAARKVGRLLLPERVLHWGRERLLHKGDPPPEAPPPAGRPPTR